MENRDILASFGFCLDSGHATQNWDCPGFAGTSGHPITSDKKAWQATQQKCAFDNNARAALTLNFDVKQGATKYNPVGLNWLRAASVRPLPQSLSLMLFQNNTDHFFMTSTTKKMPVNSNHNRVAAVLIPGALFPVRL